MLTYLLRLFPLSGWGIIGPQLVSLHLVASIPLSLSRLKLISVSFDYYPGQVACGPQALFSPCGVHLNAKWRKMYCYGWNSMSITCPQRYFTRVVNCVNKKCVGSYRTWHTFIFDERIMIICIHSLLLQCLCNTLLGSTSRLHIGLSAAIWVGYTVCFDVPVCISYIINRSRRNKSFEHGENCCT